MLTINIDVHVQHSVAASRGRLIEDPLLTEAGADFDEIYRRQEPEALNALGALAVAAE